MLKSRLLLVLFLSSMGTVMVAPAQDAATNQLFTPDLWAYAPDALACNLTNVSQVTRTVRVRNISNGDILNDSGSVTVQPQHTVGYSVSGFPNGGPIYCEFTVEGSTGWYRGVAKLYHTAPPSSDFVAIPAH
jgi:hypothetical protein